MFWLVRKNSSLIWQISFGKYFGSPDQVRQTACVAVREALDEGMLQFLDFFLDSLIVFELGLNQRTHVWFNAHYH